jgi:hypothetical protein
MEPIEFCAVWLSAGPKGLHLNHGKLWLIMLFQEFPISDSRDWDLLFELTILPSTQKSFRYGFE